MENLTEFDEFTESVSVPEPGDDRTASSVVGAFQALANRSRYLLSRITAFASQPHTWTAAQRFNAGHVANNWGVQGEVLYCAEGGAVEGRERFGVLSAFGGFGGGEIVVGLFGIVSARIRGAAAYTRVYPMRLPHGATLQSLRAPFHNSAAGVSDFSLRLFRSSSDFSNGEVIGGGPVEVGFDRRQAQPAGATGVLAKTDFAEVITNAMTSYYVVLSTSAGGDFVGGIQVGYLDPGPRNF